MVFFGRRRRLGFVLTVAGVALLMAAACALALTTSGPGPPAAPSAVHVSLVTPDEAAAGSPVSATGTAVGVAGGGAAVRLETRHGGGWTLLRRVAVLSGQFAVSFPMSTSQGVELRAVLLVGGRPVATSPTRRIAVGTPEGTAGEGASSTMPPEPSPSTTAESPMAEERPSTAGPPSTGTEEPTTPTRAYWGAWIGDQLTGREAPWDMRAVTDFEAEVGKAPSLNEFSSPFAECTRTSCVPDPFPLTPLEDIRKRGAIPFFSWSSQSSPSQISEPEYRLAEIAAGRHDAYIREFAEAAAAWGHPFFLRFDWEMNGNWFPWGAGVNGNAPGDYVAAWRHVHQIFQQTGATNVTWVWCPYVDPGRTLADIAGLYPGDAYVDWTCLDGYNWGPSARPPQNWQIFSQLFGSSYREITESVAPSKPMLVGETASSERGGSKGEWITQAFAALAEEFPRIQGLIWFDKYDNGMDWPLETSSAAVAAFAGGIGEPRYLANDYGELAGGPIPPP
jgi:hypothetical protein